MSFKPVRPVSTAFYLTSYIGGMGVYILLLILGVVGIGIGSAMQDKGNDAGVAVLGLGIGLIVIGVLVMIYAVITLFRLYYKMWEAIQDGYARTTPGKAVGFLFIPFFNLYWMFQALWGYSKDYNSFIGRHSIVAEPLPETLFLISCILSIVSCIPYIGALAGLASAIIHIILMVKICAAINAIANAPQTEDAVPTAVEARPHWRGM